MPKSELDGFGIARRTAILSSAALLGLVMTGQFGAARAADVTIDWWLPTGDPATQAAVAEAFRAKTGINVTAYQSTNAPLVQQIYAAYQRNESPDVIFITNASDIDAFANAGMLLEYTPGPVETDYPEELKSYAPFAYPYALIAYGVAYNTNAIAPADTNFTSMSDILDPAYKGKFGMPDPSTVGGAVSALFALRQHMGEEEYVNFLKGLAAIEPKFYSSNYPLANAIASGELALGLLFDQAGNAQVKLGAPVAFAYPEGAPAAYGLAAIPANADHPEEAKQFLDFLMSSEGQQVWSSTYGDTPANPVAVPLVKKEMTAASWYREPGIFAYLTHTPTVDEQKKLVEQFTEIVKEGN